MRQYVADRVQGFTESVIREMTRLCQQHDGINLAQGFPDFPAPAALKEAACRAIMADINQYAITWGSKGLREAIARKAREFNRILDVDADRHVTVTCGATEALMATMLAVIEPGDEVVIFEPFYENYGPDAIVSQAKPRYVPLIPVAPAEPGGATSFEFDPAALRAAFSSRTKAIVLNTPHNPTGKVFNRAELTLIADLCREFDALAITDEIYEYMVYEGEHVSIGSLPGMADRTVTISGLSKTFAVTGWRLGYAIAPEAISNGIRKAHDFLTVGAPAPLQEAAVTALAFGQEYYDALLAGYRQRRTTMRDILTVAGLSPVVPQGAYYMRADIRRYGMTDTRFVDFLVREVGVAAVPGTSFHADKSLGQSWIRFAFPKKPETLAAARNHLERLPELMRRGALR